MSKKLAVFDIDGTIALKGQIPDSVILGIFSLQKNGYATTINTGRGYLSACKALGENFEKIVSDEAYIAVEFGSKVVDKRGNIIYADYFSDEEIEHIADFIFANVNLVKYFWFPHFNSNEKYGIWCKNEEMLAFVNETKSDFTAAFLGNRDLVVSKFKEHKITSVECSLEKNVKVENLKLHFTRTETYVIFQDGVMSFVRKLSDKEKAIKIIQQNLDISDENLLVAGNAINDVEMLNINAGSRILVGNDHDTENVFGYLNDREKVIRVDSPEKLGELLQKVQ